MSFIEKLLYKNIKIESINDNSEKIGPVYFSDIIEIISTQEISINYPTLRNVKIPFPEFTRIKIYVDVNNKVVPIIGEVTSKKDNKNTIQIQSILYDTEYNSKRVYYRLDCKLKVEFKVVQNTDTSSYNINNDEIIVAHTLNISAGGTLIVTSYNLFINSIIELIIDLSKDSQIFATGKVLRKNNDNKDNIFTYGIEFISLPDRDHDLLTKFIFRQQRVKQMDNY